MPSLVIGDNEYKLPDNLSLDKWVEMNKWTHMPAKFISVGMDMPINEAAIVPEETQALACALLVAIQNPEWHEVKTSLYGHQLIKFDDLTLGQFIDLENYMAEYSSMMPKMVEVLFDIEDTDDVTLNDVYAAVQSYINWRKLLYMQYERLFNIDRDEEEIDEVKRKKNNTAHIWMDITMVLANNDFTKMDEVLLKPIRQCLNWLAWNKDKARTEAMARKKAQLKNKR
jgi:hypothetical protein